MAVVTLILLAIAVAVAYVRGKRDLLSPWFLLCLALFVSFFIVLINYANWEVHIYAVFTLYVMTAVVAFGLGTAVVGNRKSNTAAICIDTQKYTKRKYPTFALMSISLLVTAVYLIKVIIDAGVGSGGFSGLLRGIYNNIVDNKYSPGAFFNQLREISCAIAYMSMFRLIIRLYSKNDKVSIIGLAVPIVLFLALSLISSDRNIFLRYAIFAICVWVIVYRGRKKKVKNIMVKKTTNREVIVKGLLLIVIVFVIFYLFGKAKLYTSNFGRMLGIYGGSGLYNFNMWLHGFNGPHRFGQMTFHTLLTTIGTLLSPLGIRFNLSSADIGFITYSAANGYVYSSNIYSALACYVMDFGYIGVIVFPFILGVIFQAISNRAKVKGGFATFAFCLLIYPLIYFPIAEQFFGRFHLGFVYEIVWAAIVYHSIYRKKRTVYARMKKGGEVYCQSR